MGCRIQHMPDEALLFVPVWKTANILPDQQQLWSKQEPEGFLDELCWLSDARQQRQEWMSAYRGKLTICIWKEVGLLPLSLAMPGKGKATSPTPSMLYWPAALNLCGAMPVQGHKCASGSAGGQGKGPAFGGQDLELLAQGNDCREKCL